MLSCIFIAFTEPKPNTQGAGGGLKSNILNCYFNQFILRFGRYLKKFTTTKGLHIIYQFSPETSSKISFDLSVERVNKIFIMIFSSSLLVAVQIQTRILPHFSWTNEYWMTGQWDACCHYKQWSPLENWMVDNDSSEGDDGCGPGF